MTPHHDNKLLMTVKVAKTDIVYRELLWTVDNREQLQTCSVKQGISNTHKESASTLTRQRS